jgi:hypothetical protein
MPTKNPRVDVPRERLKTREDSALVKIAKERNRSLVRSAALTHEEVWRASPIAPSTVKRRPS